jgi:hypothetical protein
MHVVILIGRQKEESTLSSFCVKFIKRRTALKQHSSGFILGILVALILGFGVVAGVALSVRAAGGLGYEPGVLQATKTGPNSATLNLSTFPDSHVCHSSAGAPQINWVTYCPTTSFQVPPNSLITVVINNYDGATTLVNDFYRQVQGTIGGFATYNGKAMTQISADNIAHTFDIQTPPDTPNGYPIFVSVPLLAVASNAPTAVNVRGTDGALNPYPKPNVISFQFRTGPTGTYIWHCYDPCGSTSGISPFGFSGPMSTTGYMAGTMTVSSY